MKIDIKGFYTEDNDTVKIETKNAVIATDKGVYIGGSFDKDFIFDSISNIIINEYNCAIERMSTKSIKDENFSFYRFILSVIGYTIDLYKTDKKEPSVFMKDIETKNGATISIDEEAESLDKLSVLLEFLLDLKGKEE